MDRETEDDSSNMAAMFALDTWNKMMVIAGAAGMRREEEEEEEVVLIVISHEIYISVAAVAVTIFLVVCCVGDGCLLHDLLTRNKRELSMAP